MHIFANPVTYDATCLSLTLLLTLDHIITLINSLSPAISLSLTNCSACSPLVNISAIMSSVLQYRTSIVPFFASSYK